MSELVVHAFCQLLLVVLLQVVAFCQVLVLLLLHQKVVDSTNPVHWSKFVVVLVIFGLFMYPMGKLRIALQ
jgi:hypothetical protein